MAEKEIGGPFWNPRADDTPDIVERRIDFALTIVSHKAHHTEFSTMVAPHMRAVLIECEFPQAKKVLEMIDQVLQEEKRRILILLKVDPSKEKFIARVTEAGYAYYLGFPDEAAQAAALNHRCFVSALRSKAA